METPGIIEKQNAFCRITDITNFEDRLLFPVDTYRVFPLRNICDFFVILNQI